MKLPLIMMGVFLTHWCALILGTLVHLWSFADGASSAPVAVQGAAPVAANSEPRVTRLEMMRHSWESPLTPENSLNEWILDGASVALKSHVLLVPAVANRTGYFWNKTPLRTNNFEVQFTFEIKGTGDSSRSEGFGFWCVHDDFEALRTATQDDRKTWTLFGYKSNFRGLGIFFSLHDRSGNFNPSVSAAINDGTTFWDSHSQVPSNAGVYWKIRNNPEPLVFNLAVGPKGIKGRARFVSVPTWTDSFTLPNTLDSNAFIGFSAFTGPESGDKNGDMITIKDMHAWNLDVSQPGEDFGAELKDTLGDVDVGDILRGHSSMKDQREIADAIRQMGRLLFKFVSEAAPREQAMTKTLNSLSSRIAKLSVEVKELQKHIDVVTGTNHSDTLHRFNSELKGIKSLFQSQTQHHASVAETLKGFEKKLVASPSGVGHSNVEAILKQHYHQATMSNAVTGLFILLVAVFVVFVWRKTREMEKKHLL